MNTGYLEVATPRGTTLWVKLNPEKTRIGRAPWCELVLPDPRISRVHAVLRPYGSQCMLNAEGRNSILVNGRPASDCVLTDGDVLEFNGYRMALRLDDSSAVAGQEATKSLAVPKVRQEAHSFGRLISTNPEMHEVFHMLSLVADTDAPVLILGESGTGKDLAARAVHGAGLRNKAPFIPLNCGSLPSTLIESELFGHERGAFTGADRRKVGMFELADRGTLFLDEIGEMPLEMQTRLLRVLETGEIRRIGGTGSFTTDVRVIAATNRDLSVEVSQGRFRADLYYRLGVLEVRIPPLRKRKEDIPLLASVILDELGARGKGFTDRAVSRMQEHDWPGNVRELKNVIYRSVLLSSKDTLDAEDIMMGMEAPAPGSLTIAEMERRHVLEVLKRNKGNKTKAAKDLGISRSVLAAKLKRYAIDKSRSQPLGREG